MIHQMEAIFKKANKSTTSSMSPNQIKNNIIEFSNYLSVLQMKENEEQTKNTFSPQQPTIKIKIIDYLKNSILTSKSSIKLDLKSFFNLISREAIKEFSVNYKQIENSMNEVNFDSIINFIKIFYEFEDTLFISTHDTFNQIFENKVGKSYLSHLLNCLTYLKKLDLVDVLFDKDNDAQHIIVLIINFIEVIVKIINYTKTLPITCKNNDSIEDKESVENNSNTTNTKNNNFSDDLLEVTYNIKFIGLIEKTLSMIFPEFVRLLNNLISDVDLKAVFYLISKDCFAQLFGPLCLIKTIRKSLIDVFPIVNANCKDKDKLKVFKRYISENHCLERIFYSLIKVYNNNVSYRNDIFIETLELILIISAFSENYKEIKTEIFNFFIQIFEKLVKEKQLEDKIHSNSIDSKVIDNSFYQLFNEDFSITNTNHNNEKVGKTPIKDCNDFISKINFYIKEIYYLSFSDKEEIKLRLNQKSFQNFASVMYFTNSISLFKDHDYLNFLIDLFIESSKWDTNNCTIQRDNNTFSNNTNSICEDKIASSTEISENIDLLKKILIKFLLDTDLNFSKYLFILTKISFPEKMLSDVFTNTEETLSYLFSCLMIIYSDNNSDNTPFPEKEITSFLKNLKISTLEKNIKKTLAITTQSYFTEKRKLSKQIINSDNNYNTKKNSSHSINDFKINNLKDYNEIKEQTINTIKTKYEISIKHIKSLIEINYVNIYKYTEDSNFFEYIKDLINDHVDYLTRRSLSPNNNSNTNTSNKQDKKGLNKIEKDTEELFSFIDKKKNNLIEKKLYNTNDNSNKEQLSPYLLEKEIVNTLIITNLESILEILEDILSKNYIQNNTEESTSSNNDKTIKRKRSSMKSFSMNNNSGKRNFNSNSRFAYNNRLFCDQIYFIETIELMINYNYNAISNLSNQSSKESSSGLVYHEALNNDVFSNKIQKMGFNLLQICLKYDEKGYKLLEILFKYYYLIENELTSINLDAIKTYKIQTQDVYNSIEFANKHLTDDNYLLNKQLDSDKNKIKEDLVLFLNTYDCFVAKLNQLNNVLNLLFSFNKDDFIFNPQHFLKTNFLKSLSAGVTSILDIFYNNNTILFNTKIIKTIVELLKSNNIFEEKSPLSMHYLDDVTNNNENNSEKEDEKENALNKLLQNKQSNITLILRNMITKILIYRKTKVKDLISDQTRINTSLPDSEDNIKVSISSSDLDYRTPDFFNDYNFKDLIESFIKFSQGNRELFETNLTFLLKITYFGTNSKFNTVNILECYEDCDIDTLKIKIKDILKIYKPVIFCLHYPMLIIAITSYFEKCFESIKEENLKNRSNKNKQDTLQVISETSRDTKSNLSDKISETSESINKQNINRNNNLDNIDFVLKQNEQDDEMNIITNNDFIFTITEDEVEDWFSQFTSLIIFSLETNTQYNSVILQESCFYSKLFNIISLRLSVNEEFYYTYYDSVICNLFDILNLSFTYFTNNNLEIMLDFLLKETVVFNKFVHQRKQDIKNDNKNKKNITLPIEDNSNASSNNNVLESNKLVKENSENNNNDDNCVNTNNYNENAYDALQSKDEISLSNNNTKSNLEIDLGKIIIDSTSTPIDSKTKTTKFKFNSSIVNSKSLEKNNEPNNDVRYTLNAITEFKTTNDLNVSSKNSSKIKPLPKNLKFVIGSKIFDMLNSNLKTSQRTSNGILLTPLNDSSTRYIQDNLFNEIYSPYLKLNFSQNMALSINSNNSSQYSVVNNNNNQNYTNFFSAIPTPYNVNNKINSYDTSLGYISFVSAFTIQSITEETSFKIFKLEKENDINMTPTTNSITRDSINNSYYGNSNIGLNTNINSNYSTLELELIYQNSAFFLKIIETGKITFIAKDVKADINKTLSWLIVISKINNIIEVFLNENSVLSITLESKAMEFSNPLCKYSLSIGFEHPETYKSNLNNKDTGPFANANKNYMSQQTKFTHISNITRSSTINTSSNNIFLVNFSYFLVYLDKLSIENMLAFKFAQILVGKNGSVSKGVTDFKSLNSNRFKIFSPSYNSLFQLNKLKNINLNINPNKVAYEFFIKNPLIVNNKELNRLIRTDQEVNSIITKINKKSNIDLSQEDLFITLPNTGNFNLLPHISLNLSNNLSNYYNYNYINYQGYNSAKQTSNTQPTNKLKVENKTDSVNNMNNYINAVYSNTFKTYSTQQLLNSSFLISKNSSYNPNVNSNICFKNLFSQAFSNLNHFSLSLDVKTLVSSRFNSLSSSLALSFSNNDNLINHLISLIIESEGSYFTEMLSGIINLLTVYLLGDISRLHKFTYSKYFRFLRLALIKQAKYLSFSVIDDLFALSLGIIDLSQLNFFNPLLPIYITDFLLDLNLMKSVGIEIRRYILSSLIVFIEQKKYTLISHEGNFETLVKIAVKCYNLILIIESYEDRNQRNLTNNDFNNYYNQNEDDADDKQSIGILSQLNKKISILPNKPSVDDIACTIIIIILETILKFKKGDVEPNHEQLKQIVTSTEDFIFITGFFDSIINSHLAIKRKTVEIEMQSGILLLQEEFSKLFDSEIMIKLRERILTSFSKIFYDISTQQIYSKVYSKLKNLLNHPTYYLNFYDKELNTNNKMNKDEFVEVKPKTSLNKNRNTVQYSSIFKDRTDSSFTEEDLKKIETNDDEYIDNIPVKDYIFERIEDNRELFNSEAHFNIQSNKANLVSELSNYSYKHFPTNQDKSQSFKVNKEKADIDNQDYYDSLYNLQGEKIQRREPQTNRFGTTLVRDRMTYDNIEEIAKELDKSKKKKDDWTVVDLDVEKRSHIKRKTTTNLLGLNKLDSGIDYSEYQTNIDDNIQCSGINCVFCNLVTLISKKTISLSIEYDEFKKFISNSYMSLYHNDHLGFITAKNIDISFYLKNSEGPGRIRNKFEPRIDLIKNEELNKKYYENLAKTLTRDILIQELTCKYNEIILPFNIKEKVAKVFALDRLFSLKLSQRLFSYMSFHFTKIPISNAYNTSIKNNNAITINFNAINNYQDNNISTGNNLVVKENLTSDAFDSDLYDIGKIQIIVNSLLFLDYTETEVVIILGTKRMCILKNCHIARDGTLMFIHTSKLNYSMGFWSSLDYKNEWDRNTVFYDRNYTNYNTFNDPEENLLKKFDDISDKSNSSFLRKITDELRMLKFKREKHLFGIMSITISEIIEIHKRKFLHQNNGLEIFTKQGENYYFVLNIDMRDHFFSLLLKNCKGYADFNASLFQDYTSILSNFTQNIISYINSVPSTVNCSTSNNFFMFSNNNNNAVDFNKVQFGLLLGFLGFSHVNHNNNATHFHNNFNVNPYLPTNQTTVSFNIQTSSSYKVFKFSSISGNMLSSTSCCYLSYSNKLINKKNKNGKLIDLEPGLIEYKSILEEAMSYWSRGLILNFDYLQLLNTCSGRSYSDLACYFVSPWVLQDYSSEGLNLHNKDIYRNMSRPIHALGDTAKLVDKYNEADEEDKFHSGSHYSTPGFVCYFLIRIKPFAYCSAEIQGGYFDMADRLFFNINNIWNVSDKYQELIPELFYLPELFTNFSDFEFGKCQSQFVINDIALPLWAKQDPRLFTRMNKKALESHQISLTITDWIDLIFGFKQQGKDGIKAFNIFRKLCYEGKLDLMKLNEKEREDKLVEVHDFGQVPIQLFNKQHTKKDAIGKIREFFARPSYLINFTVIEKPCLLLDIFSNHFSTSSSNISKQLQNLIPTHLINNTNNFIQGNLETSPKNIALFDETNVIQSLGKGGLSSFMLYSTENDDLASNKTNNSNNTFIILGDKKEFVFHKKLEFIDYSLTSNSLFVVNFLSKSSYEFCFNKEIVNVKSISDTKHSCLLLISFKKGNLALYRLHKQTKKILLEEIKNDKNLFKTIFGGNKDNQAVSYTFTSYNTNNTINNSCSSNNRRISQHFKSDYSEVNPSNYIALDHNSDTVDFLVSTAYENEEFFFSKTDKIIFPYVRFNQEQWKDVMIHFNQANLEFQRKNLSKKGANYYYMENVLENINDIKDEIHLVEVNKPWSLLIIVDVNGKVYYLDLNSLILLKTLDLVKLLDLSSRSIFINNPANINSKEKSCYNNINKHSIFNNNFTSTFNLNNTKKTNEFFIKSNINIEDYQLNNFSKVNVVKVMIDEISGDIMILCSFHIIFTNINGVVNAVIDINSEHLGRISNITCGTLKSVSIIYYFVLQF